MFQKLHDRLPITTCFKNPACGAFCLTLRILFHKKSGLQCMFFIENLLLIFILIAFITGNSSLEPLIEGLCAQIHVNLR